MVAGHLNEKHLHRVPINLFCQQALLVVAEELARSNRVWFYVGKHEQLTNRLTKLAGTKTSVLDIGN